MPHGRSPGVLVAALLLAGCAVAPSPPGGTAAPTAGSSPAVFEPAASSELYLPAGGATTGTAADVVVLVPGGGWRTADRTGLVPLAKALSRAGFVAVNTTYRAGVDGSRFPIPVQDVACDVAFAVAAAKEAGVEPRRVVVVGHSAGGHLAALVAVSGSAFATNCPYPSAAVDALVGLAGVYDTAALQDVVTDFFGVPRDDDPSLWDSGDPAHYAETGQVPPGLRVLLVHGQADSLVPVSQSQTFAEALRGAGVDVTLAVLPDESHLSLFSADVAAPPIVEWLRSLPDR